MAVSFKDMLELGFEALVVAVIICVAVLVFWF